MKIIIAFLFLALTVSCSGQAEKNQDPEKKLKVIENRPAKKLQPKSNLSQEHISGNGQSHVSGLSSSTHISGQ